MSLQQAFGLAVQHYNSGRLKEAESLFRGIVARQPNHADAVQMLGILARRSGNNPAAIELIRRALTINPNCANANFNLGNALRDCGQLDEAAAAYRQSIQLGQNLRQSYHNLGCVLRDMGQLEEAITAFTQADAESRAVSPGLAAEWFALGNSFAEKRQFEKAIAAYQRAIAFDPEFAAAQINLGNSLVEQKQLDAAIVAYLRSIQLDPNLPQAHHNLAKAYYDRGDLDQAMAANRQAIALRSDYAAAWRNLASCLFEAGRLDEAVDTLRQAPRHDPVTAAKLDSDLIYMLHFSPAQDARLITEELGRWNRQYAQPLASSIQPHANDRSPGRRLRIGYVSPDFRRHVVGQNLLPLFAHHHREQFEIVCYSNADRPDSMTQWFQQHADGWREAFELTDGQLAQQIREDRIDILVDLALHTQGNRLQTFARRPAPVQVTFAGYPASTGLTAIDYRLSDPHLDPSGADESISSEEIIRLPHSFWCYDPGECRDVAVGPLPVIESGIVTFGCLNNFCKVNDAVLDLWSRVMQQVKHSKLLLLAKSGQHRQRAINYLGRQNIDPGRVEFISFGPRLEYLKQYHRIDISLDTFPYNGHTTSLDSLWMGVPVVTLAGQTSVARAGWSQLSNLGLTELAGHTIEQFVQIAVDLANDLARLAQLRSALRARMERSALMDAAGFASGIETEYRKMWQRWCVGL